MDPIKINKSQTQDQDLEFNHTETSPKKLFDTLNFAEAFEKLKLVLRPKQRIEEPNPLKPETSTTPNTTAASEEPSTETPRSEIKLDINPSLPIPTSYDDVQYLTLKQAWAKIPEADRTLIGETLVRNDTHQIASDSPSKTSLALTPEFQNNSKVQAQFEQFLKSDLPLISIETVSLQFQSNFAVTNIQILHIKPKEGPEFSVYQYQLRPCSSSGEQSFNTYGDCKRTPNLQDLFSTNELGLTSVSFEYRAPLLNTSISYDGIQASWYGKSPQQYFSTYATNSEKTPLEITAIDERTRSSWESLIIEEDKSSRIAPTFQEPPQRPTTATHTQIEAQQIKFLYQDLSMRVFGKVALNEQTPLSITTTNFLNFATNATYWPNVRLGKFLDATLIDLPVTIDNQSQRFQYKQEKQIKSNHIRLSYSPVTPNPKAPIYVIDIEVGKTPEELYISVKEYTSSDPKRIITELAFQSTPASTPDLTGIMYFANYPSSSENGVFLGYIKTKKADNTDQYYFLNGAGEDFSRISIEPELDSSDAENNEAILLSKNAIKITSEFLKDQNKTFKRTQLSISSGSQTVESNEASIAEAGHISAESETKAKPQQTEPPLVGLTPGPALALGGRIGLNSTTTDATSDFKSYPEDSSSQGLGVNAQAFLRGGYFFTPNWGLLGEVALGYDLRQSAFVEHSVSTDWNAYVAARLGVWQFGLGGGISPQYALKREGAITTPQGYTITSPEYLSAWSTSPQAAAFASWRILTLGAEYEFSSTNVAEDAQYITGLRTSNFNVWAGLTFTLK